MVEVNVKLLILVTGRSCLKYPLCFFEFSMLCVSAITLNHAQ